jgi:hypothetical protein
MPSDIEPTSPPHALRLTFSYSDTEISLVAGRRTQMIAPPGETAKIEQGRVGSWVELRDSDQEVLYQQAVHSPIRFEVEVADEPGSGKMRWHKTAHKSGAFELLVPDILQADTLRLYASPPDALHEPARELARITLTDAVPDRKADL